MDQEEPTFWDDILTAAAGLPIEHVVIGKYPYAPTRKCLPSDMVPPEKQNIILTAEEASLMLSYHFNRGYGSTECHPIYAYTRTHVLFVDTYDGATWINSIPRNPSNIEPRFTGSE